MARMERAAQATGADGVINVKLREGPLGYNARVMQFIAVGTAVHFREEAHRPISPVMVVPLDDAVRQFAAESLPARAGSAQAPTPTCLRWARPDDRWWR